MNRKQKVAVVVGVVGAALLSILLTASDEPADGEIVLAQSSRIYGAVVRAPITSTHPDLRDALFVLALNDDYSFEASLLVPDEASGKALEGMVLPSGIGKWTSTGEEFLLTYGGDARDERDTPSSQRLQLEGASIRVVATGVVLRPNPRVIK